MHSEIVTTITTRIDLDTLKPTTSVHVDCEDELPQSVIFAAVAGACRGVAAEAEKRLGHQPVVPAAEGEDDDL